mmetsp:Transcript_6240/g.14756  ORF Transcript_6240/g.14756 Transcript_6240/m.14756 type:complete len:230 (+) Transcript_6240:32-721(+)
MSEFSRERKAFREWCGARGVGDAVAAVLIQHDVCSLDVLSTLTEGDMAEIGLSIGNRRRLMIAIEEHLILPTGLPSAPCTEQALYAIGHAPRSALNVNASTGTCEAVMVSLLRTCCVGVACFMGACLELTAHTLSDSRAPAGVSRKVATGCAQGARFAEVSVQGQPDTEDGAPLCNADDCSVTAREAATSGGVSWPRKSVAHSPWSRYFNIADDPKAGSPAVLPNIMSL